MNTEQKRFFDNVIKPQLVDMAIDGTLPSDMNELDSFSFEEKSKEFNMKSKAEEGQAHLSLKTDMVIDLPEDDTVVADRSDLFNQLTNFPKCPNLDISFNQITHLPESFGNLKCNACCKSDYLSNGWTKLENYPIK